MKALSSFLGCLAGVLGVLLVLALVFVFLVTRPLPKSLVTSAPAEGDIVVSVDENYLSRMASKSVQSESTVIQQVVVDVQPQGQMDITLVAQVKLLGLEFEPKVTGVGFLQVNAQRVNFTLQKFEVAGIGVPRESLPASLRQSIETMEADLDQQINDMLGESELVPVGMTSDDRSVTITLKAE